METTKKNYQKIKIHGDDRTMECIKFLKDRDYNYSGLIKKMLWARVEEMKKEEALGE